MSEENKKTQSKVLITLTDTDTGSVGIEFSFEPQMEAKKDATNAQMLAAEVMAFLKQRLEA